MDTCEHCNGEPESALHALWKCPGLSQIWSSLPELKLQQSQNFSSIPSLITHGQKEGDLLEKVAMILWTIWFRRNQIGVKNSDYPISQVTTNAMQALQDFKRANFMASAQILAQTTQRVRWSPPPQNSLKTNFDGATFRDIGKARIRVIISDGEGQALASLLEQIPLSLSSDVFEALAVARAISFALEIRCSSFILKGDSEVVIRNLNKDESSLSEIGHI